MKVMLLFPPQWTPAMPHLALPALAAFLRGHGLEVVQRDLNVETYDAILTRSYLLESFDRTRARFGGAHGRGSARAIPERVRGAAAEGPALAEQVEAAKSILRSPAFYDGETGLAAFLIIVQALELASLPYYPAHLDLLHFEPALPIDNSRDLVQAAADPERNMLVEIFARIIPGIAAEQPDIVGISVPTRGQMLAAVTLAHLIKKAGLPCHITVGGPHITMLRDRLPAAPALFDVFDSAIPFAGARPLLELAETLDARGDLARVAGLVYRPGSGREVRANEPRQAPVRPPGRARSSADDDFPLPDFDGLPLERYLAPDLVLPLVTSHGCYHGRCGFCSVGYGASDGFHLLPAALVLEQMMALREKHGARHIFFADEAIPPRTLAELSALLAERGSLIDWCGCARLEPALTGRLLDSMAAGGCRMLLFGLETASERMIRHMGKGTRREAMSRVLRAAAAAGIWNHAFFFFGFPTETMADAQETVNFAYSHQDALHSASPGVFVLERFSPVHADPRRFGVSRLVESPDQDLAIYFDYEVERGLDEEMAHRVCESFLDALPVKRYGQYYLNDVNRFLYASYLHHQGRPYPLWLADEAADQAHGHTTPVTPPA